MLRTVYSYEQLQQRFLSLDETPYYSVKVNDYRHLAGDEKDLQPIRERLSHQVYDPQSFPLFAFEVTQFRTMWVLHVSSDLILLDVKSRLSFSVQSAHCIVIQSNKSHRQAFHLKSIRNTTSY